MSARDALARAVRTAVISADGRFRYCLSRQWAQRPLLLFVMLNPSTADAHVDDPTIRRCASFAHRHDFGGFEVVNLFAFRATQPADLARAGWPVGHENDSEIEKAAARAAAVCCAWGAIGTRNTAEARVQEVAPMLRRAGHDLQCLRITRSGFPQHPLYLPSDCTLQPYSLDAIHTAMEGAAV